MPSGQQLGLALKDEALARFEGDPWLAKAREAARWLLGGDQLCECGHTPGSHEYGPCSCGECLEYRPGSITIDDVLGMVGPPPRQNLPGAVFHVKGFKRVGYTTSSKPQGHGNPIGMWVLA